MELKQLSVLWDMDGTLLDTFELHYQTWASALDGHTKVYSRELFAAHFGSTNREIAPYYLGYQPDEALFQSISQQKEQLFRDQLAEKTRFFPGALEWLKYLKAQGVRQAVASSAPIENVEKIVDVFRIRDYFDTLVSGTRLPSKPAPDIFLLAAERLEAQPQRCVVFEDSIHGIRAGIQAGMITVAFAGVTNFQPPEANFRLPSYECAPEDFFTALLAKVTD